MALTITRTPDGAPVFSGSESREMRADFGLTGTTLPTWITVAPDTTGTATISGIGNGRGELTLTTAATTNNGINISLPQIDLSKFSYVRLQVNGIQCGATVASRMHIAISSRSDVVNNTNTGALLQKPAYEPNIYLRRPSTDPSQQVSQQNRPAIAFAPFAPGKRWDMGIILLPQQGLTYAMLGDQVMHARDISAGLIRGIVTPHIRIETNEAKAHSLSFSSIALTLKAL